MGKFGILMSLRSLDLRARQGGFATCQGHRASGCHFEGAHGLLPRELKGFGLAARTVLQL